MTQVSTWTRCHSHDQFRAGISGLNGLNGEQRSENAEFVTPFSPVILMVVDENLEILLDLLVYPLCLTVRLGVVRHGEVPFNVQ